MSGQLEILCRYQSEEHTRSQRAKLEAGPSTRSGHNTLSHRPVTDGSELRNGASRNCAACTAGRFVGAGIREEVDEIAAWPSLLHKMAKMV